MKEKPLDEEKIIEMMQKVLIEKIMSLLGLAGIKVTEKEAKNILAKVGKKTLVEVIQ